MFAVLRFALHALFIGLAAFTAAVAVVAHRPHASWAVALSATLIVLYFGGAVEGRRMAALRQRERESAQDPDQDPAPADSTEPRDSSIAAGGIWGLAWVGAITVLWAALVWIAPEGSYLVFPLFFLFLHMMPGRTGYLAIVIATAIAITALGMHLGFGIGVVVGPLLGAGVAILIGLGYRALERENAEREAILAELLRTREALASKEREQGALDERSRLAREIHDTVAQGLSSIQMLLHAAERDAADGPEVRYIRLARETAAESLAETRGLIRELTPPTLDDGLPAALRRLAAEQERRTGIAFTAAVPERLDLSMDAQASLLRIAQGAVSNAVRHSEAEHVALSLTEDGDRVTLAVGDDGIGFDPERAAAHGSHPDSFGLRAIEERVRQLDGALAVTSAPGEGTSLVVTIDRGNQ